MSDKILVKIILPSAIMLETQATMVNIPGIEGEFGVLFGHAKLVSNLDIGVVTLYSGETKQRYFIHGGVAQISDSEVNILTEFAIDLSSAKKSSVLHKITELKSNLLDKEPESVEADIISDALEKHETLINFL